MMERRVLGCTKLAVSRIGLGLAALGRPGYMNLGHARDMAGGTSVEAMEARAHRVMDAAWAAGVRYFDAARSYGRAEAFLASWLRARGIAPDEVAVGSKWGYTYTAGWRVDADVHEVKEHSAAVLARQSAESRTLLGAHLGLYQIHSATRESGVLENREVIEGLGQLKAEGIRVGLSVTGAAQAETLRRAMEVEWEGGRLFDAVQATWNVLEPSAGPALAEAHAAGMGIVIKEPLANGRLTDRNTDPAFAPILDVLRSEADRLGLSLDALAIAAVLANPWADIVLSGAASEDHLASNVRALEVRIDDEAADRLRTLAQDAGEYWSERSRLPWN